MRRLGLVVTKNLRVEMKYLHSFEIGLGTFITYTYVDKDISLQQSNDKICLPRNLKQNIFSAFAKIVSRDGVANHEYHVNVQLTTTFLRFHAS